MVIIEDLGMTSLDGKFTRKRHMYIVECPYCAGHATIRKEDVHKWRSCVNCVTDQKQESTRALFKEGKQICTKCDCTKPLSEFHKDVTKGCGYRSVCKACRYELEKEANARYSRSDAGKAASADTKSKRRMSINTTCDNSINVKTLLALKEQQEYKCYYCATYLDTSVSKGVHLDHVIPLSKGGSHTIENVVWSCAQCNMRKGAKLLSELKI